MKITQNKLLLLLFGLLLASCSTRENHHKGPLLAVVGEQKITADEFVTRYRDFRERTGQGVPDTYSARRKVLSQMVEEEILIDEARRRGFDRDATGKHQLASIRMQHLLSAYNHEFIAKRVVVTEEELKQLYVRANTRLRARHLYAPTREQAERLYAALKQGASFEALAKKVFHDPRLRDSGGLLGDFTVDEMEPTFEDAAFRLKVGEISKPVRTTDGYSIIRVDSRVTKPLLTETDYAKHKQKLEAYWRYRKSLKAAAAFSDSLARSLHISFNEPLVARLFQSARAQVAENGAPTEGDFLAPFDTEKEEVLVSSDLGAWTVELFQQKATFTSPAHRKWIRSREQLKEFISGLVVRDKILALAQNAGLARTTDFAEKVQESWENYLLSRMENELRSEMVVPEDSLRSYYDANKDLFAQPAKIRLREIVLDREAQADSVKQMLRQGRAFQALARKFSVRRWSAEKGGDLGYLEPADLGKWSQMIFTMQAGEIRGPLKMDGKLVFLKCEDKLPPKPRSYTAARSDVEKAVRFIMWDDYRRARIKEFRKNLAVTVHAEKLKQINLNDY
ncbi:MAG: peptidylprolyl isomerase [Calditrichaeota bacterium]|nr:MAG: peptidylprolyl isomerase [Calditrichota bacterium]